MGWGRRARARRERAERATAGRPGLRAETEAAAARGWAGPGRGGGGPWEGRGHRGSGEALAEVGRVEPLGNGCSE